MPSNGSENEALAHNVKGRVMGQEPTMLFAVPRGVRLHAADGIADPPHSW